ncbi:YdaS family helix-turn-helix protein [Paraburkholderia youngii]|uniref:YdaS family helix-turn-helix protein n=1 Tax=Paraburkholderia youngii TaxID=2782701 RepID=UPI003D209A04
MTGDISFRRRPTASSLREKIKMTRSAEALAIASAYPGMPALIRAIELSGSQELLAQAIGIDARVIGKWLHRTRVVPLEFVPHIVAAVHHQDVSPVTLRPDHLQGWALLARQLRLPPRGYPVDAHDHELVDEQQ